jgi:hypothetical protein
MPTAAMVELVGRDVVAHHVAAVVGEPELARARIPVEADRVAHSLANTSIAEPSGLSRVIEA